MWQVRRKQAYLLLYFSHLELLRAELRIVNGLPFIPIAFGDDILHLSHQSAASGTDRLASSIEMILHFAYESSLDSASSNQLSSAGGQIVTGHDQLLRRVAARDYTVRSLNQGIGRGSNSLGGQDQTLRSPVVLLVKSCF